VRKPLTLLALVTLSFCPTAVRAEGDKADELFLLGRSAINSGRYVEAERLFRESYALDPAPGTQLNWALAEELLTKFVEAADRLTDVIPKLKADDERLPLAKDALKRVVGRVATLRVALPTGSDRSLGILVDDAPIIASRAEQGFFVLPGLRTVRLGGASAKDSEPTLRHSSRPSSLIVQCDAGLICVADFMTTATTIEKESDKPVVAEPVASTWSSLGLVTAVVGGTTTIAGSIFGGLTLGRRAEAYCNPRERGDCSPFQTRQDAQEQAKTFATVSTALLVSGSILAAGGLLIWLFTPSTKSTVASRANEMVLRRAEPLSRFTW
jgi:hypothetical protein